MSSGNDLTVAQKEARERLNEAVAAYNAATRVEDDDGVVTHWFITGSVLAIDDSGDEATRIFMFYSPGTSNWQALGLVSAAEACLQRTAAYGDDD